jgi:predicted nucleic acid-binding Zn ribbon protein
MRPAEYGALWKKNDLDGYLDRWTKLKGERRCFNCFGALPEDSHDRRRFCGEKCRNAAKQRRLRERNPEAVERTQKRYWESVDLGEEA